MLRQPSVRISCLLTGSAADFVQEGSPADPKVGFPGPVQRFPEKAEELSAFDVLLLGDVDPRLFTDGQLRMVADFVRGGGGLGMVAGPKYAPSSYRKTLLAELLPVNVEKVEPDAKDALFSEGFEPALTEAGRASPICRAWRDCAPAGRGRSRRTCTGTAGASPPARRGTVSRCSPTHPSRQGRHGGPSPLLVVGRSGKGRTLFSAVDDTWRSRDTTNGVEAFAGYWVEQFRYLAAGKDAERGNGE